MSTGMFRLLQITPEVLFLFSTGAVFASFFICAGERSAEGKNWITGHSVCNSCGCRLGVSDLIPVLSYILRKGRCRKCGKRIPSVYFIGEDLLGLYFVLARQRYGYGAEAVRCMALAGLLMGLSAADLKQYVIPDGFILSGFVLWLITLPFVKGYPANICHGLSGGLLIGGGMLILSVVFDRFSGKESLGGGDIKLFFMTGLFLGPACGLFSLILSCMLGLMFACAVRKTKIPFGPAISLAVCIALLWGRDAVQWYCMFLQ